MHPIKEAATHRQGVFVFVPVADLSGGYGGFGRPPYHPSIRLFYHLIPTNIFPTAE